MLGFAPFLRRPPTLRVPGIDSSAGTSQMYTTGNILNALRWRVRPGTDAMSATRFVTDQWKSMLDVDRFGVVYRLIRVNQVMGELRQKFASREQMMFLAELLLGFEDRAWKTSKEEVDYIRIMDMFPTFFKHGDPTTRPALVKVGKGMELLKEVLQFYLVNALPTIFRVGQIFLLVGSQHTGEVQALLQQLTLAWNRYLHETNSALSPISMPDIPTNQISRETMELAFDPTKTREPGAVLRVFEGILNPTSGLGLASLPEPIAQYVQLLWHKEVLSCNFARRGRNQSQNVLTVKLPWRCCSHCSQPKEVGTVFAMRTTGGRDKFAQIPGFKMQDLEQKMEFCRRAFKMPEVVSQLNRTLEVTRTVCCEV